MIGMRFTDTNVLLYASTLAAEAEKARRAQALLSSRDIALCVQVLQEFYVQATRTSRVEPLTHDEAMGFIRAWRRFYTQELTLAVFDDALGPRQRFSFRIGMRRSLPARAPAAAHRCCRRI